MTEQEAIEWLVAIEGKYIHGGDEQYDTKRRTALKQAKEALNKQVAKHPYDKSKNPDDWHVMCCPSCDRVFWNSGQWMKYEPRWCEKCGQKIDWSDWRSYYGNYEEAQN